MENLLKEYPRVRPTLPPAYQALYVEHYIANREGTGTLTSAKLRLEAWMHRQIAGCNLGQSVLEIGAGTLNHLPFEPPGLVYDIVEPFRELWETSSNRTRLRTIYKDIEDIPSESVYDRIVSVAVLEHLTSLPAIVACAGLLLAPRGAFLAGIPTEGGALWGTAWRLTTGPAFRLKTGLEYGVIMRHEHVNTADEIVGAVQVFFGRVTVRRFPFGLKHLSFYSSIQASEPRTETCRDFLRRWSTRAS
jgi:SAM-dependent methyltransferase